ncbi:MAG: ThuA domain-containing protein [Planctomycetota bacterium]
MKRREMLKTASLAALSVSAFPLGWVAAAEEKKQKVLYFTRSAGFEHSVVRREGDQLSHSEKVLTEMGNRAGFEVECTKDGRVFDGDLAQYDVIAFYTSGDLTQPNKQNTPPMTLEGKQKLLDAIAAGKGFVAFHAANDSFHSKGPQYEIQTEVDPYIAMLGGEFLTHGAQQEASLLITSRFPGAGDLGCAEGISFTEEWYTLKNFAKDLHVILVQETQHMKDDCYQRPDFPSTWARVHGKGRVFYTSLGHGEDMWTNPFFQTIVLGGFAWTLRNVDADVTPNIDKVTPQANQLKR